MNGFTTVGISYACSFTATPFLPLLISHVGNKWLLVIGGILNTVFIISFIYPYPALIYTTSALSGIAGCFLFVCGASEIGKNSSEEKVDRNTGLWWIGFIAGALLGNLYVYIAWQGKAYVTQKEQTILGKVQQIIIS